MSFSEFYQRSINEPEKFWAEQARRIDWQTPFTQTLDHSNPPFARWFCEGRTNLCHNAIDRWLEKQPEALALIAVSSETEEERTFTFRQLHDEVNAVASMLRSLGVQRGDRVLVYMPMIAEAHITLLACARIGAIHSVVFGGFASHSVATRIDDAKPVLIVSADAGARGGKIIPYKKLLDDAISQAQHQPRHVLLVDRGLAKMARVSGRDVDFASLRHQHIGARVPVAWLESNETSCILYTSGTTGKPKGVQRDVGGYAVALATSMDTIFGGKAGGVFFCASDIGWVVGHSYIVYAPENKVITVSIADAPVKSGVHRTGKQRPVRLHKAVVVAPDGLNTAWRQWPLHYQHPFLIDATRFAGDFIEQLHVIAIHRHAGASQTRRSVIQTASNRHNRPAGFGLSVVVDDRHIQRIAHPTGGRLVQRFSSQIEHFQRRKIVFANFSGREFFQHANGGRR